MIINYYGSLIMSNQGHRGSKCYTDGVKTILLFPGQEIPDGFRPGRTSKTNPWNRGLTVYTSEKVRELEKKRIQTRTYNPTSEEVKKKISTALKGKNTWMTGSTRPQSATEKFKQTMSMKSSDEWKEITKKRHLTRKKNHTTNSSLPEKLLYEELCDKYGKEDVIWHYKDDDRYPFECDFYIKSIDKFIEYNGTWTHGNAPYDENNVEHIELLNKWKSKGGNYYKSAIKTWTITDPLKLKTLIDNNLNYEIIYTSGLIIKG